MNEIADGVFVETDFSGVNVGALVSRSHLIYIDSPTYPDNARDWANSIERMFPGRQGYLILTDYSPDRMLNTRWIRAPLLTHQITARKLLSFDKRFPVEYIEAVQNRFPNRTKEISLGPVKKPAMSLNTGFRLAFDAVEITVLSKPGPTPANLWIHIPEEDILFTGDTIVCGTFPPLSDMISSSWLDTLKSIRNEFSRCLLIPGRGEATDSSSASAMIEFLSDLRIAVEEGYKQEDGKAQLNQRSCDFLKFFPREDVTKDWVESEIASGIDRIFNEIEESFLN